MMNILIVPGFTGSGPGHWQTLWQREHAGWGRVEQRDWDNPEPDEWSARIDEHVRQSAGKLVLVAHSLGCIAVAGWGERYDTSRVAGALLVAPCDVDDPAAPDEVRRFSPPFMGRLPFPSILVASTDDPWISTAKAAELAAGWGSRLVSIGGAGHINTASGHGGWPEGLALLHDFMNEISRDPLPERGK